ERREAQERDEAFEALLPKQQERTRHEVWLVPQEPRVRVGRGRQAEPGDGDRREDEDVAERLDVPPDLRTVEHEQLRETVRIDRAGVALHVLAAVLAHRGRKPPEELRERGVALRDRCGKVRELVGRAATLACPCVHWGIPHLSEPNGPI